MLPLPALTSAASSTGRRGIYSQERRHLSLSPFSPQGTLRHLRTRSRLTNLGVLLLASFACVSFIYNLSFELSSPFYDAHFNYSTPSSILTTIERNETLTSLNHLIIVPGHAIWTGIRPEHVLDEEFWTLEDYQKGGGRISAFMDHIKQGYFPVPRSRSSVAQAHPY